MRRCSSGAVEILQHRCRAVVRAYFYMCIFLIRLQRAVGVIILVTLEVASFFVFACSVCCGVERCTRQPARVVTMEGRTGVLLAVWSPPPFCGWCGCVVVLVVFTIEPFRSSLVHPMRAPFVPQANHARGTCTHTKEKQYYTTTQGK